MLQQVEEKIAVLDLEIARRARANPLIKRLMTIPGAGPIVATVLAALAPAPKPSGAAAISPPGSG